MNKTRRHLTFAFVVAAGLGFGALASADITNFQAGQPVSAAGINANLSDLQSQVAAANKFTHKAYCGSTVATKGDLSGIGGQKGYGSARAACKTIATCGATAAHVCTADEITNDASLGSPMPSGRYQAGVAVLGYGGSGIFNDCSGWQGTSSGTVSPFWNGRGEAGGELTPAAVSCDVDKPILCCQ
jgi:hypothetical protein